MFILYIIHLIDTSELNKEWTDVFAKRDRRLHEFLSNKLPLEKSHSMPDMQIKSKKKERA